MSTQPEETDVRDLQRKYRDLESKMNLLLESQTAGKLTHGLLGLIAEIQKSLLKSGQETVGQAMRLMQTQQLISKSFEEFIEDKEVLRRMQVYLT